MDQREYFLNLLFQNWIVQYHRNEETHLVPLLLKKTPEPEGLTDLGCTSYQISWWIWALLDVSPSDI